MWDGRQGKSNTDCLAGSLLLTALSISSLAGCATSARDTSVAIDSPPGITLQLLRSRDERYLFVFSNKSSEEFMYRHWFSGGERPVLSVESMVDGAIERYDEWPLGDDSLMATHQQILFPGEQIKFEVSKENLHRVGLQGWRGTLHRVGVHYWDENIDPRVLWSSDIK
jgi:hypothetical protein